MYLEYNKIKNEIIDDLLDKLEDYRDVSCYGCDLAYTLFEGYNVDGSITYNTYRAQEWIKNNFENLGEIVEELKFQLGSENVPNVFDEPESFMVVIYLEVASYLLSQCDFIDKNWNDEITLNSDNIKLISTELKEFKL